MTGSGDYRAWGRLEGFRAPQQVYAPGWVTNCDSSRWQQPWLPFGLGRSYGDVCHNHSGSLVDTRFLDHILSFDDQNGVLRTEGGCSLAQVLELILPRGWFLPVTPGTKFVTVGGAIANDVHGKNHHLAGTFGCHVRRFSLLRSDGQILECSRTSHQDYFFATIGGMGLTGLIIDAEFSLKKVQGPMIEAEHIKFKNIDEFFEIDQQSASSAYTVAWLDCLASGKSLGRGIYTRGDHAQDDQLKDDSPRWIRPAVGLPMDLPSYALNPWTTKAFNVLYYSRLRKKHNQGRQHFDPFFYPLDKVDRWNRAYGKHGFFQYQFVLPVDQQDSLKETLKWIQHSAQSSFLVVLKRFGAQDSGGLLSFPQPGYTLALDFPNRGAKTHKLFETLDAIVSDAGGRIYPAKDQRMSGQFFRATYPNWSAFQKWVDPGIQSDFVERMNAT